jgi:hypothetical protein
MLFISACFLRGCAGRFFSETVFYHLRGAVDSCLEHATCYVISEKKIHVTFEFWMNPVDKGSPLRNQQADRDPRTDATTAFFWIGMALLCLSVIPLNSVAITLFGDVPDSFEVIHPSSSFSLSRFDFGLTLADNHPRPSAWQTRLYPLLWRPTWIQLFG